MADVPKGGSPLAAPSPATVPPEVARAEADRRYRVVVEHVVAERYDEAIREAMLSAAELPAFEERFFAAAALALDARALATSTAPPAGLVSPYGPPQADGYGAYAPRSVLRERNAAKRPKGPALGFDVGVVTGVRLEQRIAGPGVDSVGLRVGAGVGVYYGFYPAVDFMGFIDFQSRTDWQSELLLGTSVMDGTVLPNVGYARQWDPAGPEQISIGMRIGRYANVMPELSFGFVW